MNFSLYSALCLSHAFAFQCLNFSLSYSASCLSHAFPFQCLNFSLSYSATCLSHAFPFQCLLPSATPQAYIGQRSLDFHGHVFGLGTNPIHDSFLTPDTDHSTVQVYHKMPKNMPGVEAEIDTAHLFGGKNARNLISCR